MEKDTFRFSTTVQLSPPQEIIDSFCGAMQGVIYGAERNHEKLDVTTAFCELNIHGVQYQGQIHLVSNKAAWMGEDEYRFSETTKITKDQ